MKFFLLFLGFIIASVCCGQIVTTIAGNGNFGYSGDNGPATAATLRSPHGMCFDQNGNLFFADRDNNVIRKIDNNGVVTTFAGNGIATYAGDGGPAIDASFFHPEGICMDKSGNLYVTDNGNNRVRKIDVNGIVSTLAGTGTPGYSGDYGAATLADIDSPGGIVIDGAGNVLFTSWPRHVVRKIGTDGIITTFAGTGAAGYSGDGTSATTANLNTPDDLCIDGEGNIYISGYQSHAIRKVSPTGIITTFAGTGVGGYSGDGGPAVIAQLFAPKGMCFDQSGNFYVADDIMHTVRKIDKAGIITTYASDGMAMCGYSGEGGLASAAKFCFPVEVQVDASGNLYISDNFFVIRKISPCLKPLIVAQPVSVVTCPNTDVIFNISTQNQSDFQWQIKSSNGWIDIVDNNTTNGSKTNKLSIIQTTLDLTNTQYRCIVTNSCDTSISSEATLQINAQAPPEISIEGSSPTTCYGVPIMFKAKISGELRNITYRWKKNMKDVGINGAFYSDSTLKNSDTIICIVQAIDTCSNAIEARSNTINVTVYENPTVVLNYDTVICNNSIQLLDAGDFYFYEWNNGYTGRTLSINKPGVYSVNVIDEKGCKGTDTAFIQKSLTAPIRFLTADTSICANESFSIEAPKGFASYLWSTGSIQNVTVISQPGEYWLKVEAVNGCIGLDTITVLPKVCTASFFIPSAFTPNSDGKNDLFRPIVTGQITKYRLTIYNRWGEKVFESNNISEGWNGKVKGLMQATGVYIWNCQYQLQSDMLQKKKGTITLIR